MKFWRVLIKATGLFTLILSCCGFYRLAENCWDQFTHPAQVSNAPFFRAFFFGMNMVDFIFLAVLSLTAIGLMKVSRRAVGIYSWTYLALLVYVFAPGAFWGSGPLGMSLAAASGVGDYGISPLIFFPVPFVYGVVSVAAVNLAMKQLRIDEALPA